MTPPDEAEAALLARLERLGIAWTMHRHHPVFTVDEARALRGALPGGHAKNLFLKDKKDRLYLAVVTEDVAVDLKALEKTAGAARLSFGRAELMAEVLGVAPGSVTPFALMNAAPGRIEVLLDSELMAHEPVNFHPLHNAATLAVSPAGLTAFLADCGHEPRLIGFRGLTRPPI
jgi:Ala-tRNA(Pro) deacylase